MTRGHENGEGTDCGLEGWPGWRGVKGKKRNWDNCSRINNTI